MDVLYDVTNLGMSFGTELTRTGIFRATEAFVREILRRPDVNARFAATQSYVGEVQLARFDRSAGGLLRDRWIPAWENGTTTLAESMELVDQISNVGQATAEGRRLAAGLMLADQTARPRAPGRRFDVYHSLRSPLVPPERVKARVRVVTIYDMIPSLFPELVDDRFVEQERAVLNSIDPERDWIVCSSACTKGDVCRITAMSPDRIFVTPLAAASQVFHPEHDPARRALVLERYGIRGRDYVLGLCTLEPRKNLVRLVRAFFTLVEEHRLSDLLLVLVGPTGWKSEPLFATLRERPRLAERVVLTGFVPDADLSPLYSGARMFVFPTLYEGFGLPALEAMQCGVPVITSRTSSLPEVVGDDAISVNPTDEPALTQAMLDVLRDGLRAGELARRGLQRARRFSWARTVEETVRAYRAMLAGS